MKNLGIICAGVVIGVAVTLLVGADNTQKEYGRFQLAFGKFQMNTIGKNANSVEQTVCMKIDTATGRVWTCASRLNEDTKETVQEFFPIENYIPRQTQKIAESK